MRISALEPSPPTVGCYSVAGTRGSARAVMQDHRSCRCRALETRSWGAVNGTISLMAAGVATMLPRPRRISDSCEGLERTTQLTTRC
jgi:hypothetical protein